MSTPCEKHAALPVVGQSPCAGCEIERLMAENEALHAQVDTLAEWYANSLTECEALRKDADRYRWLRDKMGGCFVRRLDTEFVRGDMRLDSVIDVEIAKAPLANPGQ